MNANDTHQFENVVVPLPADIVRRLESRAEREGTVVVHLCAAAITQIAVTDQYVTGMRFASGRPTPHGTETIVMAVGRDDQVRVQLKLPWQHEYTDWIDAPIIDHEIVLPGLKLAFLCHAKEDKEHVATVGAKLMSDGYMTWYDEKSLSWHSTL